MRMWMIDPKFLCRKHLLGDNTIFDDETPVHPNGIHDDENYIAPEDFDDELRKLG